MANEHMEVIHHPNHDGTIVMPFVPANVLGNALATIVMARWERALDLKALHSELHDIRPSP